MVSPFRKVHLFKIAQAVSAAVLETLLSPSESFCALTFGTINLNPQEFGIVEDLIKACLGEYVKAICIVYDTNKIEVSKVALPKMLLSNFPSLSTSV